MISEGVVSTRADVVSLEDLVRADFVAAASLRSLSISEHHPRNFNFVEARDYSLYMSDSSWIGKRTNEPMGKTVCFSIFFGILFLRLV